MTTYLTFEIIQFQRQCFHKIDVIEIWKKLFQLKHFSKFDIFRFWFFISLKIQAQCQMKRWWNNILIYFVFDIFIWIVEQKWDSFNEKLICYSTLSIKKCSLKSLNVNDRSKTILINFASVFLKVDKFNQYLIHVLNAIDHQILFAQSSKLILSARVRTVVSQLAHQSAITYDYHLSSQNSKVEWAHFNAVKITEIDSLSQ